MSLALDWLRTKRGEDPMIYIDDVFRYAMARLRNREDAEDIACEVVQSLPNPCNRRELRIYMLGVARRKIADHRRRDPEPPNRLDVDPSHRFDSQSDHAAMVESVLGRLSEDHREVLNLKYIVGLSCAEIGSLLGRKSVAIDSLLQRARAAFGAEWTRVTTEEVEW